MISFRASLPEFRRYADFSGKPDVSPAKSYYETPSVSPKKSLLKGKIIMGEEKKIVFQLDDSRTMEISTGKVAGLANGSCLVRMGDSIVLTTEIGRASCRERVSIKV